LLFFSVVAADPVRRTAKPAPSRGEAAAGPRCCDTPGRALYAADRPATSAAAWFRALSSGALTPAAPGHTQITSCGRRAARTFAISSPRGAVRG